MRKASVSISNPHALLEALKMRPKDVFEVRLPADPKDIWLQIQSLVDKHAVKSKVLSRQAVSRGHSSHVRGAWGGQVWLRFSETKSHGVWVALDGVQDPTNVGNLARTAAFYGINGFLIPKDRAVPLDSPALWDIAAGALEHLELRSVTNLVRSLKELKSQGYRIIGAAEEAETEIDEVASGLDQKTVLVLGSEQNGLRPLVRAHLDKVVSIKGFGALTSLNVATAGAILLRAMHGPQGLKDFDKA